MLVVPAIDIRAGHCVRLLQGDPGRQITYSDDPVAVARQWADLGAPWLHVVDLDGAFAGVPANLDLLQRIAGVGVPVQTGGGFRMMADVEAAFAAGAARVILGTTASSLAGPAAARFGEGVAVAVDMHAGVLVTHGWTRSGAHDAVRVVQTLAADGVARFIYTNVARDGMLGGAAVDRVREFVRAVNRPVIAAGGVASAEDLHALRAAGVEAVIVGRALYEGRLSVAELRGWKV